ncbi:MAG: hypothetical protein HYX67_13905 [Candidatus Melainabacteria bacterium]|nr:hypothetical protein [Candidatus Melainabacteria bacterium]
MKQKKNLLSALFWITGVTLLSTPPAFGLEFAEFGMINLHTPLITNPTDPSFAASGGFAFGGGITLGFTVWKELVVEPGLTFSIRNFSTVSNTQPPTGNSIAIFQVPLVVRYWFTENLSGGLGGYFGHYSGDLTQTQGTATSKTYWSGVLYEYGVVTSIRLKSPINELMSVIVDGRFLLGLTNADSSDQTTKMPRDFQIWAGIAFIL